MTDNIKETLVRINWKNKGQLRYVGDIVNDNGDKILTTEQIKNRSKLNKKQISLYRKIEENIRTTLCESLSNILKVPVGEKIRQINTITSQSRIPIGSGLLPVDACMKMVH